MEGETSMEAQVALSTPAKPAGAAWAASFRTPSPPPRGCIEPITPIHTPQHVAYMGDGLGNESPKRRRLNKPFEQLAPLPPQAPTTNPYLNASNSASQKYANGQPPQGEEVNFNPLDFLATVALQRHGGALSDIEQATAAAPPSRAAPYGRASDGFGPQQQFIDGRGVIPVAYPGLPLHSTVASMFPQITMAKDKMVPSATLSVPTAHVSQHPSYPSSILTMPENPITFIAAPAAQSSKSSTRSRAKPKADSKTSKDRRRSNRHAPKSDEESAPPSQVPLEYPATVEKPKADVVVAVRREADAVQPDPKIVPENREPPSAVLPASDISSEPSMAVPGTELVDGERSQDTAMADAGDNSALVTVAENSRLPASATVHVAPAQAAPLQPMQIDMSEASPTEKAKDISRAPSPLVHVASAIKSSLGEPQASTMPTPPLTELPHPAPQVAPPTETTDSPALGQVSPATSDETVIMEEAPISPPTDAVQPVASGSRAEAKSENQTTVKHDEPLSKDGATTNENANEAEKQKPTGDNATSGPAQIAVETVPQLSIVNAPPARSPLEKTESSKPTKSTASTGTNHGNGKALDEVCNICSKNVSPMEVANGTSNGLYVPKTGWIRCDGCKKWCHNSCASLTDKEVDQIDKFHCPACVPSKGSTTYRRKSTRVRASIDYGALHEGSTIPLRNDDSVHHYVPSIEDGLFEFAADDFERITPDKLAEATCSNPVGWNRPVVITAESNPRPVYTENDKKTLIRVPTLSPDDMAGVMEVHQVKPDSIGMKIPHELTVRKVAQIIGADYPIDVIDVKTQNQDTKKWPMGKWADYYETKGKDVVRNVISLEVSDTPLGHLIERPEVVRKMDLSDWSWPVDSPEAKAAGKPTSVKLYCLMSVEKAYTDFHIDFGGSSVFYHIVDGSKTFFFIEPTDENLKAYEDWCNHPSQNYEWLAKNRKCYRIDLFKGDTMLIPSGWIHAVYTPSDSLVIGGNFITRHHFTMQMKVHGIETRTKVPRKFRYPLYAKIHWFSALKYMRDDPIPPDTAEKLYSGSLADNLSLEYPRPGKPGHSMSELEGLPDVVHFLARNSLIANGDIDGVTKETKANVGRAIPKTLSNFGYEFVKDFAVWVVWKRACGEAIPEWARPGCFRGQGFPGVSNKFAPLSDDEYKKRVAVDKAAARARFEAYAGTTRKAEAAASERSKTMVSVQIPVSTPMPLTSSAAHSSPVHSNAGTPSKPRAKRKRDPKIDEEVFKEAVSRVQTSGTFVMPKLTILGPLKTACDNCSKKKVRCVHKEEVQAKQKEVQEMYNKLLKEKQAANGIMSDDIQEESAPPKKRASSAKGVRSEQYDEVAVKRKADSAPVVAEDVVMEDVASEKPKEAHLEPVNEAESSKVGEEGATEIPPTVDAVEVAPPASTEAPVEAAPESQNVVTSEVTAMADAPAASHQEPTSEPASATTPARLPPKTPRSRASLSKFQKGGPTPDGIVAKNGRKKACANCRAVRRKCLHNPDGTGIADEAELLKLGVNVEPMTRKKDRLEERSGSAERPLLSAEGEAVLAEVRAEDNADTAEAVDIPETPAAGEVEEQVKQEVQPDTDVVMEDAKPEAEETVEPLPLPRLVSEPQSSANTDASSKKDLSSALASDASTLTQEEISPSSPLHKPDTSTHPPSDTLSDAESDLTQPGSDFSDHDDDLSPPSPRRLIVKLPIPFKKTAPSPVVPAVNTPRRSSRARLSPPQPPVKTTRPTPSPVKRKHPPVTPTTPSTLTAGKRARRASSSRVEEEQAHRQHGHGQGHGAAAGSPLEGTEMFEESKIHEFGLRRRRSSGR